jgi:hypothetical protein
MSDTKKVEPDKEWYALILAYKAKFDDSPPIFQMGEEAKELMRCAIDTGVPMKGPDVPEGALI